MSGKPPYFPNNWKKFKDAPAELFDTHTFEEIMSGRSQLGKFLLMFVASSAPHIWRPARSRNVYKRQHAAEAKVTEYMNKLSHEFVVCTHDTIHYVHPEAISDEWSNIQLSTSNSARWDRDAPAPWGTDHPTTGPGRRWERYSVPLLISMSAAWPRNGWTSTWMLSAMLYSKEYVHLRTKL